MTLNVFKKNQTLYKILYYRIYNFILNGFMFSVKDYECATD